MFNRHHAEQVISKGLTTSKAVSMADLHRRRRETQSQYYTPEWVAQGLWHSITNVTDETKRTLNIIDPMCGNGRLFSGAPSHARMHGFDIDQNCISALVKDNQSNDTDHHFQTADIANIEFSDFDIAVINPAFSIQLSSPNLYPFDSNSYGIYGPRTNAISHIYCLELALKGSDTVVAVLPMAIDDLCKEFKRLHSIIYLPQTTFIEEGANVKTAVYIFSQNRNKQVATYEVMEGDTWPVMALATPRPEYKRTTFNTLSQEDAQQTITLPFTGNKRVELHHHNRKIVIKYHCGLTQAKVANGLMGSKSEYKGKPRELRYSGEGCLLLDAMLLEPNNDTQLEMLAKRINSLGGECWISPTLTHYYKKLVKRHLRAITPMYRVIKGTATNEIKLIAKARTLLDPKNFKSPAIAKGEIINAQLVEGDYLLKKGEHTAVLRRDMVAKRFLHAAPEQQGGDEWVTKHEGLNHHFPALASMHDKRITNAGIEWLAPFQRSSLIEGLVSPYGYLAAWEQGSGKARLAIALAKLHDGKSLIVVNSGLIPEFERELVKLNIPESDFQVLKRGDTPKAKINITAYNTLRAGYRAKTVKYTRSRGDIIETKVDKVFRSSASQWRRLFNTVICDEGGLLSNLSTQQTRAVKLLSANKLIILDGTPQSGYPRDLLPLSVISAGNGVAHQPYGTSGKGYIRQGMCLHSNKHQKGEDVFFENHVICQWVTNEFKTELQSGAKREVPKINNLPLFREWLAPNIQRRLRKEPDLAIFNNCPAPVYDVFNVKFDDEHFKHYLETALEFADWYKKSRGDKVCSLVTVLARIGAVQRAANSPHVESKSTHNLYMPLTSKQRKAIERIKFHIKTGKKTIFYAQSPDVLNRIHHELSKANIKSVLYTGQQDINKRAVELDNEFRFGDVDVLLSSWVGQRGLNLEQASVVIFYERNWSAAVEEQAVFRTQRPAQTEKVEVEYLMLKGGIDEYMAQLVDWKRRSADAGLDFGEQAGEDEEFLHLDTILSRFCSDIFDMSAHELRDSLRNVG